MTVIYRTEQLGLTGITSSKEVVGCYPAKVSFLTRALAYSGSEVLSTEATLPIGSMRITFNLQEPFDFTKVQFKYKNNTYIPIWPGLEIGKRYVYTCRLEVAESSGKI